MTLAVVLTNLGSCALDEKPLWVIAIMHGHRNPRVMAAILHGREA
jgi:hypothetical protein